MPAAKMDQPPKVSDVDIAFGGCDHMPDVKTLPEDYRNERAHACTVAQDLFFKGGKMADYGYTCREGVDQNDAIRAIRAVLGSFQPKHEHKIAAVGWMIDQWFVRDAG